MTTALFIGRFQPFHLGHLSVVRAALTRHQRVIIAIGSAQYANTTDNPYSYEDRVAMIRAALNEDEIDPARTPICALPDIHDNERWVAHVRKLAPPFDAVITGSNHVRRLFEEEGQTPVEPITFLEGISGTRIREAIKKERSEWKKWVPNAILTHLFAPTHTP